MPIARDHTHAGVSLEGHTHETQDQGALTVVATGSTASRTLAERWGEVFNVKDYGAKGDGTTDDTDAINLAFAAAKVAVASLPGFGTLHAKADVYFPPGGRYLVTSPINATEIRGTNWSVTAHGAVVEGKISTGDAVFDLVGSRFCTLRGLTITAGTTDTPKWGIQMGRYGTENSDFHAFQQVTVLGHFTGACLYNYASEDNTFNDLRLWNENTSATSYCMIMEGNFSHSMTSEYATITATTGDTASHISNIFISLDARKRFSGPCIKLKRTSGFRFYQCYGVSHDNAVVTIACDGFGHRDLHLDMHCEGDDSTYAVLFLNDSETNPVIDGFTYRDANPFAKTAIFQSAAGISTVTFKDYDIKLPLLKNNPLYFDDKAKFKLFGGRMHIGNATRMQNLAEQVGTVVTDDRDGLTIGPGSQLIEDASNRHMALKGSLRIYDGFATNVSPGDLGNTGEVRLEAGFIAVSDGITAPAHETGVAKLYVDTADGDLKVKFSDGTVKTIATDT